MSKLFSVGQSKVKSWRQCRRAYHLKHVEELQRKRIKRPFMFGKIVHRMLEAHGQREDPMAVLKTISFEDEKLFTSEKEMYGEIIHDIGVIMREYFKYWDPTELRYIPVIDPETDKRYYTEHEFAIPMNELTGDSGDGDMVMKGQVDEMVKTPNGLRWVGENKTFDKLPGDDERWRNLQSIVYRRAILHLGWMSKVDGVFWDYIMSKPPTQPTVLKNGKEFSAADIVTLPSVVRRAVKDAGFEWTDKNKALLALAEACRPRYFQRFFTPVSTTVADNIFDGFVETAREMRDNHGRKKDQNIGRHCSWCDYEPICRAELTGGDVDFVKEREYTHEDPEAYRRSSRDLPSSTGPEGAADQKAGPRKAKGLHVLR